MAKDLSEHRILVTGGSGFVGGHIVKAFKEQHPETYISILDVIPSQQAPDVEFLRADVTSPIEIAKAIRTAKPTVIIHAAGIVPGGNDRYSRRLEKRTFEVNVNGTKNILAAAMAVGIKYFVFTGSVCSVTDDIDANYRNYREDVPHKASLIYGRSKGEAERLVLRENSPTFLTCSIRPSVICGPGDYQLVPTIQRCISKFETPFIIGDADNLYDFSYVGNVADAHVLAVENLVTTGTAAGEAFSITNGEPIPFRDFCRTIWAHFGHVPPFQMKIPLSVAWVVGFLAECVTWLTGMEATISRGSVKDYTQTAYADTSKARLILGYEPRVSLIDGLKISCEDLRQRLEAGEKVV